MRHHAEKNADGETKIDNYLYSKAFELITNFISNYNGQIGNHAFFQPITSRFGIAKLMTKLAMLEREYPHDEDDDEIIPERSVNARLANYWNEPFTHMAVKEMMLRLLEELKARQTNVAFEQDPFYKRCVELKKTLGFNDLEMDFILLGFLSSEGLIRSCNESFNEDNSFTKIRKIAAWLNTDQETVHRLLIGKNRLHRFSCVDGDFDYTGRVNFFLLGLNERPLYTDFYNKVSLNETLPWDYYGKLAEDHGSILKKMISAGQGKKPVNILLYGTPGTGKTSFAKSLAKELGLNCYAVTQSVNCGAGPSAASKSSPDMRFAALDVCSEQINQQNSLIIVDEADDMLRCVFADPFGGESTTGDKGHLNDTLDNNHVPTIWITNTGARALDESSRRRFDYSIRFEPLSVTQRISIWNNGIARFHLEHLFDDAMVAAFAKRYSVSAGGISMLLQNVATLNLAKEDVPDTIHQLMKQHCELMGVAAEEPKLRPAKDYTLNGLNIQGGIGPEKIVKAVRNFQNSNYDGTLDRPRMNILLSGVPGSGKTEFVKYLADTLNTKIIVKMGSDLLDKYVGETEHRIREAFEQAEAENAILFLDEIDGMLQNREFAERSFEVTPVNELLHRMENFNGIFIGATNFYKRLDPAVIRRFTFKLEFDYLKNEGKKLFFEHMFKVQLTSDEEQKLDSVRNLTPGDFRTVRQSLFYLGDEVTNADRLDMLEAESKAKNLAGKTAFANETRNPEKHIGFL